MMFDEERSSGKFFLGEVSINGDRQLFNRFSVETMCII
jgi:hypothetical protein